MLPVVRHVCTACVVVAAGTLLTPRKYEAPESRRRVATAPVVVATVEIPEGRAIDPNSVTIAMWPVPTIPAGAYSSVGSVINRVARINVFKGEPLVPGRLAPEGTSTGLEVKLTPGKRAYSIRVNDVTGIAGMILPNSRVDVLVTLNSAGDLKRRVAKVFMSNVRVLAIGAQVQRGADGRPINSHVATLELTPEELEKIAIAANSGTLSLALRGYGDSDSITTTGTTANDVVTMLREAPEYKTPLPLRVTRRSAPAPRRDPDVANAAPVGSKQEVKKFQKDSRTAGTPRAPQRRPQ